MRSVVLVMAMTTVIGGCFQGAHDTRAPHPVTSLETGIPDTPTPNVLLDCPSQPSCYSGIVPGKTRLDEALASLHQFKTKISPFDRMVWWSTPKSVLPNRLHFADTYVVDTIVINESSKATLGDIVKLHGDPQLVILGHPGGELPLAEIVLVYPSMGLAFLGERNAFGDESLADKYVPTSSMLVHTEIYFVAGSVEAVSNQAPWDLATDALKICQWQGFGVSYWPHSED